MERLGYNQASLSRATGLSYQLIHNIVNLRYIPEKEDKRNLLCAYLKIEPDLLFDQYVEIVKKRNEKGVSNKLIANISKDKFVELGSIKNTKYLISGENVEEESNRLSMKIDINSAISGLKTREQEIVKMYYGLKPYNYEYTLKEIADELCLTRERIRQIILKSLRKLKRYHKELKLHL